MYIPYTYTQMYIYTYMHIHSHTYAYTFTHICTRTQFTQTQIHTLLPFFGYETPLASNKTGDLQLFYLSFQNFSSMMDIFVLRFLLPWFYYPQFESVYISVHRSSFLAFFISIEDIAINETPSHPKTFHSFLAFPHLSCMPCLPLSLFKTTCSLSWEVNCCLPLWALWLEPFREPWETETIS